MKTSKILFVTVGLLLIIGSGCSSEKKEETASAGQGAAASGQGTPVMKCQEKFIELDVNKDGKVTLQEFMAVPHPGGNAELIFKARDKDVDGVLVVEEFCQGKGLGKGPGAGKQ